MHVTRVLRVASFGASATLFYGQIFALRAGFREIQTLTKQARECGDVRVFDALTQRQRLGRIYAGSVGFICLLFGAGMPLRSLSVGSDIWQFASLVPSLVLAGVVFVGVFQAQRIAVFYQSQIKMMHYYWHKLGAEALRRPYYGVLVVTDLAGMGAASSLLRTFDTKGIQMLNGFINLVRADVLAVVSRDFALFNDKTNGDQDIILLNATDREGADRVLVEVAKRWRTHAGPLLAKWRTSYCNLFSADQMEAAIEVASKLDLHIFMGTYEDMMIRRTLDGKLDSTSMTWIDLAGLEKPSFHNRVGIMAEAVALLQKELGEEVTIESDSKAGTYFSWDSGVARGARSLKLKSADFDASA